MMELIRQRIMDIPPFTRYYLSSVLLLSAITSSGIVSPKSFIYIPSKVFGGNYEIWRIFTSFCYYGELSFNSVIELYFMRWSLTLFENMFETEQELIPARWLLRQRDTERVNTFISDHKTHDFLYYIFSASIVIFGWSTLAYIYYGTKFVQFGNMLQDFMIYVLCKRKPDTPFFIFVFPIHGAILPYVMIISNAIIQGQATWLMEGYQEGPSIAFERFMKSRFYCGTLISFGVAHLWWFVREELIGLVHVPLNGDESSEYLRLKYTKNRQGLNYWLAHFFEGLRYMVLPPWYWILFARLEVERRDRITRRAQGLLTDEEDDEFDDDLNQNDSPQNQFTNDIANPNFKYNKEVVIKILRGNNNGGNIHVIETLQPLESATTGFSHGRSPTADELAEAPIL